MITFDFRYIAASTGLIGALLLAVAPRTALDKTDKCDTAGLYPMPHLACGNPCADGCNQNGTITTNNNHSGVTCTCNTAGVPPCCTVAYVASINDYEPAGDCTATNCAASGCVMKTVYDIDGKTPVERYGKCQ
jgi:hypothetical protein